MDLFNLPLTQNFIKNADHKIVEVAEDGTSVFYVIQTIDVRLFWWKRKQTYLIINGYTPANSNSVSWLTFISYDDAHRWIDKKSENAKKIIVHELRNYENGE